MLTCVCSISYSHCYLHDFEHFLMASTSMLTVKICQPSHEFTFGVGISFIPYPLVLTLVV
jgi:hypothetical protein